MLKFERKEFASIMINCFQNYRANISVEMVDEWFEELSDIDSLGIELNIVDIKNAFRKYTNETENFPPTRAAIINLAKLFRSKRLSLELKESGCKNFVRGNRCGKEISVVDFCLECWESVRVKNIVEIKIEKILEFRLEASRLGLKDEKEINDFVKQKILNDEWFLKNFPPKKNDEMERRFIRDEHQVRQVKNLMRHLDALQQEKFRDGSQDDLIAVPATLPLG